MPAIAAARRRRSGRGKPPVMALLSRGRPVDDISPQLPGGSGSGVFAVDAAYHTIWRLGQKPTLAQPQRLALDLANATGAQRTATLYRWRNDSTIDFWNGTAAQASGSFNNVPRDYTLQGHAGAGGGAAPAIDDAGWVTLATVAGNVYRDRIRALNLAPYNWVQLRVTDCDGPAGNDDVGGQIEVFNVSPGRRDVWLHLGDSIVSECMSTRNLDGSAWTNGPLAQQITTLQPARIPLLRNGGVNTTMSDFGATNIAALLLDQAGGIVTIGWGTNDAAGAVSKATYKANMSTIIAAVIAADNWPIVSLVPKRTNNAPADAFVVQYNAAIAELAAADSRIILGPDFYTPVANGTIPLRDDIHPTWVGAGNGYEIMQGIWATWAQAHIY